MEPLAEPLTAAEAALLRSGEEALDSSSFAGRQQTLEIDRTFRDLAKYEDVEQLAVLQRMGVRGALKWNRLLESQRVLIVSEAGAGKTHECRVQQQELWDNGEPAFYLDLAGLKDHCVAELLSSEEEERLNTWQSAQSEIATFFLDSIDELELTLGGFERTLKRFAKDIAGNLGRARIVITTRPIPVDQEIIRRHLPLPETTEARPGPNEFADVALSRPPSKNKNANNVPPLWRNVALMPLSDEEIVQMARGQRVSNPEAMLADLRARDALDFARRPQDLIELCADWNDRQQVRNHADQVSNNIAVKLKPRTDRPEKAELSDAKALDGASRLALAMLLMRRLTIRHNAAADKDGPTEAALDPVRILPDWTQPERETLLERALFGFHTYGRVKFHHRSVVEFLAAERLAELLRKGLSIKAVKRLLFTQTAQGETVPRPSLRPVSAWLARRRADIFEALRDTDPSVLLDFGDPASLRISQRSEALRAYVARYGHGGWRGMHVPLLQVQRFTSPDLETTVKELWEAGIENPEVRSLLLDIIAFGKMTACADLAYFEAVNSGGGRHQRIDAVVALHAINDQRLSKIVDEMEQDRDAWPNDLARSLVVRLFPQNIPPEQLCRILSSLTEKARSVGELTWSLPQVIAQAELSADDLSELRSRLTQLVTDGIQWDQQRYRVVTPRLHLVPALISACLAEWKNGAVSPELLASSVQALRLTSRDRGSDDWGDKLSAIFDGASAVVREEAFWADDAMMQSLKPQEGWDRLAEAAMRGAARLEVEKDLDWITAAMADISRPLAEREMLLQGVFWMMNGNGWRARFRKLLPSVEDQPTLTALAHTRLELSKTNPERKKLNDQFRRSRRNAEKRAARAHASWVKFWTELSEKPEELFGARAGNTVWNLWRAMERSGTESRAFGWNRRFIEQYFNAKVADQMRTALMQSWRKDKPTLPSERPEKERGTFLVRWQLGVAAIAAESEDPAWASKLSEEEAELAARYVPIEFSGFPSWLENLTAAHPRVVDRVLGKEFSWALDQTPIAQGHSSDLHNVRYAAPTVAQAFLPYVLAWLEQNLKPVGDNENADAVSERLTQATEVLLTHGGPEIEARVRELTTEQLALSLPDYLVRVWLPIQLRLDPESGVARLEQLISPLPVEAQGDAIGWLLHLIDGRYGGNGINLSSPGFPPHLLLRLLRLAYTHIRISDDQHPEGVHEANRRDRAQDVRNAILNALINSNGPEGWAAKMEMADDPLASHFRDRLVVLAREHSAGEADIEIFDYAQMAAVNSEEEPAPANRDGMFALMRDRLDDLEELLRLDTSPRGAWAPIKDEKTLRRAIAHELVGMRRGAYTVDQEATTADEKETDIRLRSVAGPQAVIELKIGEKGRSAAELRDTLREQVVIKYMASDDCRAGCLLISTASNQSWRHPDTGASLNLAALIEMLNQEAAKLEVESGGAIKLFARGLDLRPRLPTEAQAKKNKNKNKSN